MKKTCSRILSLVLALSLVLSVGVFQMATPALAAEQDPVDPRENPSKVYMIRQVSSGLYMDVGGTKEYWDVASGNSVVLSPESNSRNLLWKLVAFGDDYYRIVSIGKPGMMLNVYWKNYGAGNLVNARSRGAFLSITNAQRFDLVSSGNNSFCIQTTSWPDFTTDYCIGYDGTELVQRDISNSDDNLKWEFIPTDSAAAYFSDWFSKDSNEYNHALATWAMELSDYAYNPLMETGHIVPGVLSDTTREIKDELVSLGFHKDELFQKGYTFGAPFAHTIAHQFIDLADETAEEADIHPLVVLPIRGSASILDWLNDVATATVFTDQWGFNLARDKVLESLRDYLLATRTDGDVQYRLIDRSPKILITGHSQGAAIANLVTAHLNDCTRYSEKRAKCEFCKNLNLDQNNIYGYTFATPRVERDIDADKQKTDHGNLFNILNNNDVVTWVPSTIYRWWPNEQRWCRYGRSVADTMKAPITAIAPVGVFGHAMSTYLRWLQEKWSNPNPTFEQLEDVAAGRKAVGIAPILVRIKCPVDVTIYDNQGNVAGQIINEVAIDHWEDSGIFAWVTADGAKNFFLPYGSELSHAQVVARDGGTMELAMAKVDALSDEPYDMKAFDNILLEKGREYYIDLSGENIEISDVRLMVTENNVIIGEVATDGVTTVPVKNIAIEGDHQRILTVGQTTLLTVSYIPTLPTNRTIIWTSSNEAVATVDINGVVTAHSPGGAIITGTSQDGGYKDQCIITVEPATEISILGDPTIILTPAQQHQLTADVTINSVSRPITWSSSNEAIAVVSTNGTVTGVSVGNAIITATTKDGKTASVVVNVENQTSITIMGDATRILALGQQHQLIANVTNNSTSLPVTWSSSNEAVAPVTASGLVTAGAVGSAMITATTKDGYVAQVMITVEASTAITIAGDATRVLVQGTQLQLNANVTSNSTALPLTWTSSNEAVATVTANGLVAALSLGSTIITATTKDGYAAQVLVTVEAGTAISIVGNPTRTLKTGAQEQLVANVTNNSTALPITWASSNDAVTTVSASGLVTALTSGSAVITATTKDGFTAQVLVTVEGNTTITIVGDATRILTLGQQYQLAANVTQNSTALPITWSSSNETVAPITAGGMVTALKAGTAIITATTKDGFMAQVLVSVEAATEISIAGAAERIATLGKTIQLTATVTQNNTALPITWASSNTAVAAVSANGLVTANAIGSAMITATTKDGVSAQVMINVEAQTTITIAGEATRILTLGLSEQLFANVPNNSTALPITWTSSNTAVATVNEYGIVTAKAAGSAMITATTKDGVSAQVMITVEAPTTLSLSNVPSGKLVVGKTHKLIANVPHNSTALPITWTSSNEAVATISADGVITPKAPGNTIITATTNDGLSEQIIVSVEKEECAVLRWLRTLWNWIVAPFKWLWNAISYPFRTIGKL